MVLALSCVCHSCEGHLILHPGRHHYMPSTLHSWDAGRKEGATRAEKVYMQAQLAVLDAMTRPIVQASAAHFALRRAPGYG
jgi:hypothetical protein